MKVQIQIDGQDEVITQLRRLGKAGQPAVKRVFGSITQRVAALAKPLTPVDDEDGGDLKASVRATKPVVSRSGRVSAGVVAGGTPLKRLGSEAGRKLPGVYASIQHEDLSLQHRSGGPKFIERPFFQEAPKAPDEILEEIDKEAGRG